MLERARARRLNVSEADITSIPFDEGTFDVTCAFKVLAHVPEVGRALAEMARVTRPGGVVIAEFYNPMSLRGLAKWAGPVGTISPRTRECDVYTRFDPPWVVARILPPGLRFEAARGVRIVTPYANAWRLPLIGRGLGVLERRLADTPFAVFAGFYIAVLRKGPQS
jgi:SAM-dependent methyltransferase